MKYTTRECRGMVEWPSNRRWVVTCPEFELSPDTTERDPDDLSVFGFTQIEAEAIAATLNNLEG